MEIQQISREVVYGNRLPAEYAIEFSPLDHLIMGHFPLGAIYGFDTPIDLPRLRSALNLALDENPEMGVAIHHDVGGRQVMVPGRGIELVAQKARRPMVRTQELCELPSTQLPLAKDAELGPDGIVEGKLPLLGFRVTYFEDGGCTLGIRTTHSHVDGTALTQFILNVGNIYNGRKTSTPATGRNKIAELGRGSGQSFSAAFPWLPMPESSADAELVESNRDAYCCNHILIPEEMVSQLTRSVRTDHSQLGSADIINGAIWKAWALSLAEFDNENPLRLYGLFDIRKISELGLPENYQGNAVLDRMAQLTRGELLELPLAEIARCYREQVKPLRAADVAMDIAYLTRLHQANAYDQRGNYVGFLRRFFADLISKQGLFVNDVRFLNTDKVEFSSKSMWYDSSQDYNGSGYLEISRRPDRQIVFRYHSAHSEKEAFEWHLRKQFMTLSH